MKFCNGLPREVVKFLLAEVCKNKLDTYGQMLTKLPGTLSSLSLQCFVQHSLNL